MLRAVSIAGGVALTGVERDQLVALSRAESSRRAVRARIVLALPEPARVAADLGESVQRARMEVDRLLGRVDILVNNAGNLLCKPFVPLPGLEDLFPGFDTPVDEQEWAALHETHLGGAVRTLRAFGGSLIEQKYGRVVNVVSNVVRRTVPFTSCYDTAKGAIVQLTRSLAREWARYGVTVNAIAAGHFPTAMSQAQFDDETSYRLMLARVPAGRHGTPEEFAALVAYLCGEEVVSSLVKSSRSTGERRCRQLPIRLLTLTRPDRSI